MIVTSATSPDERNSLIIRTIWK